jgi:uracil-DNA glycosylase family 4
MSLNNKKLQYIAGLVQSCRLCPLYKTAHCGVPGAGNLEAKVFFIGEAPGHYEDLQGLPFVGNSGKLLDKLFASINLSRQDVFIGNIVKHRPPENRDPLPFEIKACIPYLKSQLKIIKPQYVITLGRFAMNYFFPTDFISKVHGQVRKVTWNGLDLTIVPVYHPSAALRNGAMFKALQQDFVSIGKLLGTI